MTGERRESPYVGLTAYAEEDAEFFFGRQREIDLVIANLKASRLTLLYGESGVGKSSILLAGAMRRLHADVAKNLVRHREDAARNGEQVRRLPVAVALFRSPWATEHPLPHLMQAIHQGVSEAVGGDVPEWKPGDDVVETLREWTKLVRTILVVLDQFEEYFVYHPDENAPDTVAAALPAVVNDVNLRVNFLLSIREDALAKLDRFKKSIAIFGNVLRINFLDDAAAHEAIVKPLTRYTELSANGGEEYRAEPELVTEVIRQVQARNGERAPAGSPAPENGAANGKGVDTPVLQLVLTRLWEEEQKLESRVLRLETFRDRLESTARIMSSQLERTIATLSEPQKDIAASSFRQLVTQSGSKFAQTVGDLAGYADAPREDVEQVLVKLEDGRILRSVSPPLGQEEKRYEILHDALGETVLEWTASHLERRAGEQAELEAKEQTRKAHRRARIWAVVGVFSLATMIGVALLALYTLRERQTADSGRFAARSRALLGVDPHRAVQAALEGWDVRETAEAERALREAMSLSRLRLLHESKGELTQAKYSEVGRSLLTAGSAGTAHLLNIGTGARHRLTGHEGTIRAVGFNAAGSLAVTAGDDGTARVWAVDSGRLAAPPFTKHEDIVMSAVFSPSEPLVMTAGYDGRARIWEAATGKQRAVLGQTDGEALSGAEFSPAGNWAITTGTGGDVALWKRPASGWRSATVPTHILAGHTDWVNKASFSQDGKLVVTASEDKTARVWNVASGAKVAVLDDHDRGVNDAVFRPDSESPVVATVSAKTLRFWNVERETQVHRAQVSSDWVYAVDFRDDGDLLLTAGAEGIARVWDTWTGTMLFELRGHTDAIATAAFADKGKSVVTASTDGTARVWDARTGLELRGHDGWVHGATFDPDTRSVFTVGADSYLGKWDTRTGKNTWWSEDRGENTLNGVALDPTGRYAVTVGDDKTGVVWDAKTGDEIVVLETGDDAKLIGHTGEVLGVDFDPRPEVRQIATAGADGRALIWSWRGDKAQVLRVLDAKLGTDDAMTHRGVALSIAYSADGLRLFTSGSDKAVRVWNPDTGALLATLTGARGMVAGVAVHPSGDVVATVSEDATVRVWRVSERTFTTLGGEGGPLRAVAFNQSGNLIAAAGSAGYTYVWEWPSGKLLAAMKMHADMINAVAFGPGDSIITASDDGTAKIYRCVTCGPIEPLVEQARNRVKAVG